MLGFNYKLLKSIMKSKKQIKGIVRIVVREQDEIVYDSGEFPNIITDVGVQQAALSLADFKYLALGTDNTAPTATDTTLGSEITTGGLERAEGTVTQETTTISGDTHQVTHTWTATDSHTVQEIGMFDAVSSGNMLGRALTDGAISLINGQSIDAIYKIVIERV